MAGEIRFSCPKCSHKITTHADQAGNKIACPSCSVGLRVPTPRKVAPPGEGDRAMPEAKAGYSLKFACGRCGQRQFVPREWAGETIVCFSCEKKVKVPVPASAVDPTPASAVSAAPSGATPTTTAARRPAPRPVTAASQAPDPALAALYELEEVEEQAVAPLPRLAPPPETESAEEPSKEKPKRKKKKKRKGSSVGLEGKEALSFGGMVLGFGLLAVGVAYAIPPLRVIVGLLLLIGGGVLAWIGNVGFATAAREEGIHHGLLCKFIPLYKWYFLMTRWDRMRDLIALYIVGCIMLPPGFWLFRLAGDDLEAEAKKKDAPSAVAPAQSAPAASPLPAPTAPAQPIPALPPQGAPAAPASDPAADRG